MNQNQINVAATATQEELWQASLNAERAGHISEALAIHEQVLVTGNPSSSDFFRLAWLYFLEGRRPVASQFYNRAMDLLTTETETV